MNAKPSVTGRIEVMTPSQLDQLDLPRQIRFEMPDPESANSVLSVHMNLDAVEFGEDMKVYRLISTKGESAIVSSDTRIAVIVETVAEAVKRLALETENSDDDGIMKLSVIQGGLS